MSLKASHDLLPIRHCSISYISASQFLLHRSEHCNPAIFTTSPVLLQDFDLFSRDRMPPHSRIHSRSHKYSLLSPIVSTRYARSYHPEPTASTTHLHQGRYHQHLA